MNDEHKPETNHGTQESAQADDKSQPESTSATTENSGLTPHPALTPGRKSLATNAKPANLLALATTDTQRKRIITDLCEHMAERGLSKRQAARAIGTTTRTLNKAAEALGMADALADAERDAASGRIRMADEALAAECMAELNDRARVSLTKATAEHHRWVAARLDRDQWGAAIGVEVTGKVTHIVAGSILAGGKGGSPTVERVIDAEVRAASTEGEAPPEGADEA